MKRTTLLFAAALALLLSLCGCTPPQKIDTGTTAYTSQDLTLSVPNVLVDLLTLEPADGSDANGTLFTVREKASWDTSRSQPEPDDNAGLLFSIGRVSSDTFMDMMCQDTPNIEAFARDAAGNYLIYYHPADTYLFRADEPTTADWDIWYSVSDWAVTVKDTVLADNPQLTPYERSYTDLDFVLCNVAHRQLGITLSPYEGDYMYASSGEQSAPFLERFPDNLQFISPWQDVYPEGEFIKLSVPNLVWTFDFFTEEGETHCIRQTFGDAGDTIWFATVDGEPFPIGEIIAQWTDYAKTVSPPEIKVPPTVSVLVTPYYD